MQQDLIALNKRGLIPGPNESEEAFYKRASACLANNPNQESLGKIQATFDVSPDWLVIEKKALLPWHAAVTIIKDDQVLVQMSTLYKGRQSDVLAHEMAHAARMAFDEPYFEEFLATQVSASPIRRFIGALLQGKGEVGALIISLVAMWVYIIGDLLFSLPAWLFFGIASIPLAIIGSAIVKQLRRKKLFVQCCGHLKQIVGDKALFVIYRLTDKEIILFANLTPDQIRKFVHNTDSLRWRVLKQAYF